jgi:hypothetical protein
MARGRCPSVIILTSCQYGNVMRDDGLKLECVRDYSY